MTKVKRVRADRLIGNSFVAMSFDRARPALAAEHAFKKAHYNSEFVSDELQFYFMRVGASLARMISHCEQLEHALVYLTTFRMTARARAAGASKQKYLRFVTESYLVRTQTTIDLALKLLDAVFHLTNDARQCRFNTIMGNVRVRDSESAIVVKKLDSRVHQFAGSRNIVVHHGGYSDRQINEMELPAELLRALETSRQPLPRDLGYLPQQVEEMTRAYVIGKTQEYDQFNEDLVELVGELFDALVAPFQDNERRLRSAIAHGA